MEMSCFTKCNCSCGSLPRDAARWLTCADLRDAARWLTCASFSTGVPQLRRNTHVTPFRRGPREPCVTLCVRLSQQAVPKLRRNTHVTPFRRGLSGKCTWESIGHLIRGLSPWVSEAASSEAPVLSSSLLVCQLPAQSYSAVFKTCFLLKFHCFAVLYWFQLYSIVIPFFYRWCASKSVRKIMAVISCAHLFPCCSSTFCIVHQRFICQKSACDLGFLQYNPHLLIHVFSFARLQFHSIMVCIILELDYACSSVNQFEIDLS